MHTDRQTGRQRERERERERERKRERDLYGLPFLLLSEIKLADVRKTTLRKYWKYCYRREGYKRKELSPVGVAYRREMDD